MLHKLLLQNIEEKSFADIISFIDSQYHFTPVSFKNGEVYNEVNQNNGSCKVLFFGKINNLNETDTLKLFSEYYRVDVLQNPNGEDHQNIRNFIKFGWGGVEFDGIPLQSK